MANNRSAIRAAVKALLVGNTSANQNVYTNRETKLWQSELPAITLYTLSEPAIPESISGRRYVRTMELAIKVRVEASSSIDDDLDGIVGQVEDIILANPGLSGTVLSTILTNTVVEVDSSAEEDLATATLTFECKYIS